jgi:predicted DNA binding CopG/RHH family protein
MAMKLDKEERELVESVERGEWRRVPGYGEQAGRVREYAKATMRKDERVNIRISERDLVGIQRRAVEEGLPYQTLISSVLHKYVTGRLREAP